MQSRTRLIALTVALGSVPTSLALAREPLYLVKQQVAHVSADYLVDESSRHCSSPQLTDVSGQSYCWYPGCLDTVHLAGSEIREVTFVWDRDAKTSRVYKEVVTQPSEPSVSIGICAIEPESLGVESGAIPASAFKYRNINGASLSYSPISLRGSQYHSMSVAADVKFVGTGEATDQVKTCESYADTETNTCFTVKNHVRVRKQRVEGTVSGSWASGAFIDDSCLDPTTGCVPQPQPPLSVDYSPARAINPIADISETWGEQFVETIVKGKCSCPIVPIQ